MTDGVVDATEQTFKSHPFLIGGGLLAVVVLFYVLSKPKAAATSNFTFSTGPSDAQIQAGTAQQIATQADQTAVTLANINAGAYVQGQQYSSATALGVAADQYGAIDTLGSLQAYTTVTGDQTSLSATQNTNATNLALANVAGNTDLGIANVNANAEVQVAQANQLTSSQYNAITSAIGGLAGSVSSLNGEYGTLSSDISGLSSSVQGVTNTQGAFAQALQTLAGNITNVQQYGKNGVVNPLPTNGTM